MNIQQYKLEHKTSEYEEKLYYAMHDLIQYANTLDSQLIESTVIDNVLTAVEKELIDFTKAIMQYENDYEAGSLLFVNGINLLDFSKNKTLKDLLIQYIVKHMHAGPNLPSVVEDFHKYFTDIHALTRHISLKFS